MRVRNFLFALSLLFPLASYALAPEARIADETKEQRAMNLFLEVRCLVCEGQVIESSNTEFSLEMRKLIRRKIIEGKSDEEIRAELVQEFGADILNKVSGNNDFLLWLLPMIFALGVGLKLIRNLV
jgi:cytochrome c-type biogenesis protein CcmH